MVGTGRCCLRALALALLTVACSRAESETIEELEAAGALPKLDRTDSLTGTDSDQNGVRDDIDAFIAREYPSEPERKELSGKGTCE